MSYIELQRLFEQFFALVEAAIYLPPTSERRIAFREVCDYGVRIDKIAARTLRQDKRQFSTISSDIVRQGVKSGSRIKNRFWRKVAVHGHVWSWDKNGTCSQGAVVTYARFSIDTTFAFLGGTRDTTAALARSSKAVAMYLA